MKSLRGRLCLAVLVGSLFAALPASAQTLDPPSVTVLQSKPSSVRLMVTAGPSGAPAGFFLDRMTKAEFDSYGGWPVGQATTTRVVGSFTGAPTFNIEGTATTYHLAAGQSIEVELGQLFDETGVAATDYEELDPGTQYVFRIRANNDGATAPSAFTNNIVATTTPPALNCTNSQGYWKNHTESWPVSGLTLGTVNYTAAQLLAIFDQPAQGNKLTSLAHQLIAAKLNLAQGANPSAVASTIAAADALIGGLVVRPIGNGNLPASPATTYANLLDDFNNGLVGPGHCGAVPATAATWGTVKALYRR